MSTANNIQTITISGTGTLTQAIVNNNIGSIGAGTLLNIVIEGYTTIDELAFASYTNNLVEVTIPNTVITLGRLPVDGNQGHGPFNGCTVLQTVTFQENSQLTFIGIDTFTGCSS